MGPSMCTLWLVVLYLGALGSLVVLPMGLQTPSALSVLSLIPPLGSPCSVQWLAVSIHICIDKALAEPLMPDQYRFGYMQPNIRLSMGTPMEELEEWLKEMKVFAFP